MALYKAKKELFELEDSYFGVHKIKAFKEGQNLEITEPNKLPKKVLECLESNKPKKKKKGDK